VTTTVPQRIIIDCDPGIGPKLDADDGLAILFALASPELQVEAITTVFGNVSAPRAADNALRVLEAVGRTDIPVARGMETPLTGVLQAENVEDYAAQEERLKPIREEHAAEHLSSLHAVDLIVETVMNNPGEITILAVGPLTNVAMAILKEPALKSNVREIVIMGGAFGREPEFGRGNITPVAELNIWNDPLAAEIVFQSGIPVTAAGLDVTNPNKSTVLYEDQLLALLEGKDNQLVTFLDEMCRAYIAAPKFDWARKGCVLYDPVAAAALAVPSLVTTINARVRIGETGSVAEGQTVAFPDDNGIHRVCVDIDGKAFVQLFIDRITKLIDTTAATR
jgi:purine nucleosidase